MTEQHPEQHAEQAPEPSGLEQQAPRQSVPQPLGDDATGDIVIDAALQDLRDAPDDDLDAQIDAGRRVQQTLQARLGDLGGE